MSIVIDFVGQIHRILDDYEARGREPQRVLEMVAYQAREYGECNSSLPRVIAQIRLIIDVWEKGDRTDLDALETIAALVRQSQMDFVLSDVVITNSGVSQS